MSSYLLGGPPPQPVIVTIKDIKDYIRVLLYSYYTTITERGVLLGYVVAELMSFEVHESLVAYLLDACQKAPLAGFQKVILAQATACDHKIHLCFLNLSRWVVT